MAPCIVNLPAKLGYYGGVNVGKYATMEHMGNMLGFSQDFP